MANENIRCDWSLSEIRRIFLLPITDLIFRAQTIHRRYHRPDEVQACALLSIKTGGCPEDCAYCPQSSRYNTGIERGSLMTVEETITRARNAREHGATRFCLGAAWRDAPSGDAFQRILKMVKGIRALGMEACCTLGMLTESQAAALANAGLSAYNHNLDTSPEFYPQIISTRKYEERLLTLKHIRRAGITVCCGGIIGMGESRDDRCSLLRELASMEPHPESVPINLLVRAKGTPLANEIPVDPFELVRMIATARILMPKSKVRLSAGRTFISDETQALCFLAGANSIFIGEQLLTTANPKTDQDKALLSRLGLRFAEPSTSRVVDSAFEIISTSIP